MLQIFKHISDIDISKLRYLYRQQLVKMQRDTYPHLDSVEGELSVDQDFYFDTISFFRLNGAFIAIWYERELYIAALKMEKYSDGFLLSGLETDPEFRNKGFGTHLIESLLAYMSSEGDVRIYSHIKKDNFASLLVHQKCGFQILYDYARFVDGTVSHDSYTLCVNIKSDR